MEQERYEQIHGFSFPLEQARVIKRILKPHERVKKEALKGAVQEIYDRTLDPQAPWFDMAVEMIVSRWVGKAHNERIQGLVDRFEDSLNQKTSEINTSVTELREQVTLLSGRIDEQQHKITYYVDSLTGGFKQFLNDFDERVQGAVGKINEAINQQLYKMFVRLAEHHKFSTTQIGQVMEGELRELKVITSDAATKISAAYGKTTHNSRGGSGEKVATRQQVIIFCLIAVFVGWALARMG